MSRPLRIALVDDQDLVRTGFRMILDAQRDMCVVGQASDGVGALSMVRTTRPDVVLMDIRMPALDGIAATRAVLEADPGIKVIVLTTFDLDDYLVAAMRAGASGFLLKDTTAPELIAGIRAVARGDSVVAPSATRRLLDTLPTAHIFSFYIEFLFKSPHEEKVRTWARQGCRKGRQPMSITNFPI